MRNFLQFDILRYYGAEVSMRVQNANLSEIPSDLSRFAESPRGQRWSLGQRGAGLSLHFSIKEPQAAWPFAHCLLAANKT